MKNIFYKTFFILIFTFAITFPVISKFLKIQNDLQGVEYENNLKELNFNNLFDYSFQDSFDEFIEQKLPGKSLLVRSRNQILFDIFKYSPHTSLNLTKNNQLISDEPMDYYYHGLHEVDDCYVNELVSKLNELNNILKNKNADLVVLLTPTKARYVNKDEYLTDRILTNLSSFDNDNYILPYDKFVSSLNNTDIKCFDAIDYLNKRNNKIFDDIPLYYDSGHHWSVVSGNKIGIDFLDYVSKNTNVKFSKLSQTVEETDSPIYPDSDILDVCNLFRKPKYKYYKSNLIYEDISHTKSNIIIRDGSFMGEIPFVYSMFDNDSNVLYMENAIYFYDNWQKNNTFNSYDELDLKKYTKDINLIILEIHEINVYNATFGFLDYLLEHKDLFG